MKKARTTRDTPRESRIATLEGGLAQLFGQLTALQTRVGSLEAANRAQQEALAQQVVCASEHPPERAAVYDSSSNESQIHANTGPGAGCR